MGKCENLVSKYYLAPLDKVDGVFREFVYPTEPDSVPTPIIMEMAYNTWEGFCALTGGLAIRSAEYLDSRRSKSESLLE